jgi:hypothetical protein
LDREEQNAPNQHCSNGFCKNKMETEPETKMDASTDTDADDASMPTDIKQARIELDHIRAEMFRARVKLERIQSRARVELDRIRAAVLGVLGSLDEALQDDSSDSDDFTHPRGSDGLLRR